MKAAQFHTVGEALRVAEAIPKPRAEPGGLMFKVKACGICASDLHAVEVPRLAAARKRSRPRVCGRGDGSRTWGRGLARG